MFVVICVNLYLDDIHLHPYFLNWIFAFGNTTKKNNLIHKNESLNRDNASFNKL